MREISIDGRKFFWSCGKTCVIVRGGGKVFTPYANDVLGISAEEFENAQWKGARNGMVKPSDVASWIRENV